MIFRQKSVKKFHNNLENAIENQLILDNLGNSWKASPKSHEPDAHAELCMDMHAYVGKN